MVLSLQFRFQDSSFDLGTADLRSIFYSLACSGLGFLVLRCHGFGTLLTSCVICCWNNCSMLFIYGFGYRV